MKTLLHLILSFLSLIIRPKYLAHTSHLSLPYPFMITAALVSCVCFVSFVSSASFDSCGSRKNLEKGRGLNLNKRVEETPI